MRNVTILTLLAMATVIVCGGCHLPGGSANIDEGFTIHLATTQGPRHVQKVKQLRQQLEQAGWKNMMSVGGDGYSKLMWGKYRAIPDAARDIQTAKEYTDASGNRPFQLAVLVPMPGADVGKPEWNLLNTKGRYTVLVFTYFNDPKIKFFTRKRKAVEQCGKFREEGYEAYYYHGPTRSYVTVGAFPVDSLETVTNDRGVRTIIRDPEIIRIMKQFPELVVNDWGRALWITIREPGPDYGKKKSVRAKTYPIEIPTKANEFIDSNITAGQWKRQ